MNDKTITSRPQLAAKAAAEAVSADLANFFTVSARLTAKNRLLENELANRGNAIAELQQQDAEVAKLLTDFSAKVREATKQMEDALK